MQQIKTVLAFTLESPTRVCYFYFDIYVLLAPDRQPRQPVLAINSLSCLRPVFRRKDAARSLELWPSHLAANCARRNPHLGIIAQPLTLSRIRTAHHIDLSPGFAEPDRCRYRRTILAECGHEYVLPALDLSRDRHQPILRESGRPRRTQGRIAVSPPGMLQAKHAQMDARAP